MSDDKILREERDALARVIKVCRNTAEKVMNSQTSGPVKDIMANLLLDTADINPDVILEARDQRVRREALREAAKHFGGHYDWVHDELYKMAESHKP